MSQIIDITEELILQLREIDHRYWTILIQGSRVAMETRGKVSQVGSDFLYHHTPGESKTHSNRLHSVKG